MPTHRRLTAALVAACLVWSTLVVVDATSATAAPAAAPRAAHDPATYYAGTEGLSGAPLAARLHTIIRGHTKLSYAQLWSALPQTDPAPGQSGYLTDFYSGTPILVSNQCGSGSCAGKWNREHTWAQSHGNFGTSAGIGTDLFHMRPSFADSNSSRGNKDYDDGGSTGVPSCATCLSDSDSFEPRAAVKGDVARGLFYMAVRYEGDSGELDLKLNDRTCNGSGAPNMGKLSTLVAWSLADPPDDRERARNDLVDSDYQHNRNPFIDHPEWVTSIFGSGTGAGPACGSTSGTEYVAGGSGGGANTPPTTTSRTVSTPEDAAVQVALTASDADGDPLTWSISQTPVRGTAALAGAVLTYTPSPDSTGTDQVGVTVSDGRGGTASTTVTIVVTPVNDAPVAQALTASTPRNTAVGLTLVATDVDDTELTYAVVGTPAHGSVQVAGDTATYTPDAGYAGPESFTYAARDPAGAESAPATVSLTVVATQQAPVAPPVEVSTPEDQPVTFTLTAHDPDGDPLTYAITSQPARGSLTLLGARATYEPDRDFHGADAFGWSVSDGTTTVSSAATIDVAAVNDAPVARSSAVSTLEGAPVDITLVGTDVDGDPLTYAVMTPPHHGTVTLAGATATYAPATRYRGDDSFTWTVSDGTATTPASTTVTVVPVNRAPSVTATSLATTAGSTISATVAATDDDSDPLSITSTTEPALGTVEVDGMTIHYTPSFRSGTDTFSVTVSDGRGGLTEAPISVEISALVTMLSLTSSRATRGTRTTTVVRTSPSEVAPTGPVTLRSGSTVLGRVVLGPDGSAVVAWTPTRAGSTPLVASYDGDAVFEPASSSTSVQVLRSTSRPSLAATGPLRRGRAATFRIGIATVAGVAPTGRIQLTVGGRRRAVALTRGIATVRVATLPRAARVRVLVRYPGDGQYLPATVSRGYALKR